MPSVELPVGIIPGIISVTNLVRETIVGGLSGSGSLTRPSGPVGVDAFGFTWDFFTIPAGFGSTPGNPTRYENRMLQLGVVHADLGGHLYYSEYHDFDVEGIYLIFERLAPVRLDYNIAPGVVITGFWLVI
jgi:hypothetical protein